MKLDHIEVDYIRVNADKGKAIVPAIRDAIKLSATEERNVKMAFNGREYFIKINELIEFVCDSSDYTDPEP